MWDRNIRWPARRTDPYLEIGNLPSMILWGPPGTGKTTLARLLALVKERPLPTVRHQFGRKRKSREILPLEHNGSLFSVKSPLYHRRDTPIQQVLNRRFTLGCDLKRVALH